MNPSPLDPYSISQTDFAFSLEGFLSNGEENAEKLLRSKGVECKGSWKTQCIYHAPYFAYQTTSGTWFVKVGCCHHWDCPKCGLTRAKTEYWRIVSGCAELAKAGHELWFLTITTRGKGLSVAEAEQSYLLWTNRLMSNLRQQARRQDTYWCYVQVTERQKRRHPHSHILTTYFPMDIFTDAGEIRMDKKLKWEKVDGIRKPYYESAIRSENLQTAICSAGLGEQYDFSLVRESAAVARYVGKYLFKSSLLTVWPKKWRRVRYSHNWPKPEELPKTDAIALVRREDWLSLAYRTDVVRCPDAETARHVTDYMYGMGVQVSYNK